MTIRAGITRGGLRLATVAVGAAMATTAFAGATGVAHASTLTTGEGSLSDSQNETAAALSDATAVDAFTSVQTASGVGTCAGSIDPVAMRKSSASTGFDVYTTLRLTCQGYNAVDLDFALQRHRWYGWENLNGSSHIETYTTNYKINKERWAGCRAGTWSYRGSAWGYINNNYVEGNTKSMRVTCVDTRDINYVDLS